MSSDSTHHAALFLGNQRQVCLDLLVEHLEKARLREREDVLWFLRSEHPLSRAPHELADLIEKGKHLR